MAIIANPENEESTHHIKLTNARGESIGILACSSAGVPDPRGIRKELYQGSSVVTRPPGGRYDDRQAPYIAIEQSDFSAGRGQEDFERNRARFEDSGWMWSAAEGRAYPAPIFNLTTGYISMDTEVPGSVNWRILRDDRRYIARKFTASASYTASIIRLIMRPTGAPAALTIELRDDSSGSPGSVLQSTTLAYTEFSDLLSQFRMVDITAQALTATTDYWVVVWAAATDDVANNWEVGVNPGGTGVTYKSSAGSTWTAVDYNLYYGVIPGATRTQKRFYEYKGVVYFVTAIDGGGTPKIYRNGFRGVATGTQSSTTLKDTTQTWTVNALAGAILKAGSEYKTIVSNTSDTITVSTWDTTPVDTTTEYAVFGLDTWQEVTGHGLTASVTWEPLVTNDILYFPQGDSVNIRRVRELVSGGVWTLQAADDDANKAFILLKHDEKVFRFTNSPVQFGWSNENTWPTNFTFAPGNNHDVGDDSSLIVGGIVYDNLIWAIKEDSLHAVNPVDDSVDLVLDDLKHLRSPTNGRAVAVKTPNMYYTVKQGLEEFFSRVQTDIGPNRDKGLPLNRQGTISAITPSVKYLFVAIDAGRSGYSSVHVYSGGGWHEIYRAPYGERIRSMWYQAIEGLPARLWIGMDRIVGYLEMAESGHEPFLDTRIEYHYESYLETSYYSDNLLDIDKFWAHLKLFTEGLTPSAVNIEVDYKVDDDTAWTPFSAPWDTSPSQEEIPGNGKVTGKRIKFRIRFYTLSKTSKAILKSIVPDYVARYPTSYAYSVRFLVNSISGEGMEDWQGDESEVTGDELLDFLERAKIDPIPMVMESVLSNYHNKRVIVHPASYNTLDVAPSETEVQIGHLRLLEAT